MTTSTSASTPTGTIEAYVYSVTWGGPDVLIVELRPVTGAFPQASAGSHIDIHLPVDGRDAIRQYSLINSDATPQRYLIAVFREPQSRGGSRLIHDVLRVGHIVDISAPRNTFPLARGDHHTAGGRHVLLGGGIGVTPLAAMAQHLVGAGEEFELHTYASTRRDAPLADYIGSVLVPVPPTAPTAPTVPTAQAAWHQHYSDEEPSFRTATALPREYQPGDHVYICGPAGFIDHAVAVARDTGWPEDTIHVERFQLSEPVDTTGEAFEVVAHSTGERMPVGEQQTIAEVLVDHGYHVELSCEQGICGSCITGVVSGVPDHRDEVQSEAEHQANTQINVCCSRSRSAELVLDL